MDTQLVVPSFLFVILGAVGLIISVSGIAHTFMEGLHAVCLLMLVFGLILLPAALLKGGFPQSGRFLIYFLEAGIVFAGLFLILFMVTS
ncbi:MAG: hypothetical protein CMO12_04740 [Thaumarchaeota archaeon]|nr:hypothetical protein [Nitrososphaerota archaeon]